MRFEIKDCTFVHTARISVKNGGLVMDDQVEALRSWGYEIIKTEPVDIDAEDDRALHPTLEGAER